MDKETTHVTKGTLAAIGIFVLALIGACFLCYGIPTLIGWFMLT